MNKSSMPASKPTVYYDGSCPLCRREIGYYRARSGAENFDWTDVSAASDGMVAPDLCQADAMARFHVRDGDGRLVSGAPAFARLWSGISGFRWLGAAAGLPVVRQIMQAAYRGSLVVRPWLQRRAAARKSE